MDDSGGSPYKGLIATVRKKRSQTPRRPRPDYSRDSSAKRFKGDYSKKRHEDGGSSATCNNARRGDATTPRHVAYVRQLGNAGDGIANDSKLKKLKSKVGGATSISQTKNSSYGSSGSLLSYKSAQPSDASHPRQNLIPKDKSSEDGPPADKKSGLKGILCKDFPRHTFGASKSHVEKKTMKNVLEKQGEKRRENLKIQRRPRRRLVLNGLDEDEDDDEIHYSEKLKLGGELRKTRSPGLKADKSSEDGPPTDKKSGLKGISCKDFPRGTFGASKSNVEKMPMKNVLEKQGEKPHQNLKIQRMPRKRLVLDGLDEDDDEIHYSEKLKLGGGLRKSRSPYQDLRADKSSEDGPPADKKSGLKGISCKDFPRGTFGASKSHVEKKPMKNVLEKQGEKRRENFKIQRRPRRRLVLNGLDEDEDDDEIHYSEKLKLGGELRKTRSSYQGLKANKSSEDGPPTDKNSGLKGISCKDFPRGTFGASKSNVEKMPMKNVLEKQGEKPHQNLKIQRMPRKRLVLDGLDEDDDEIHYSEKLKLEGELLRKTRSPYQGLKADKNEMLEDVGSSGKEVKRISNRGFEYTDYEEQLLSDYEEEEQVSDYEDELLSDYKEEELLSDGEDELLSDYEEEELLSDGEEELLSDGEAKRTKKEEKRMKESFETSVATKSEISLTTRQRALLSRRDSSATSVNQIGYPYGRPPAPPQKQKEKLSEVEQQQKKAVAAQRRRIQNENAARESEAEAIRKVLGQDSDRKKREEKTKQQEELAQEKAAKELAPNTIRTVMGPAGTTVTFSYEIGLPSIFYSKPRSYPPPRETCAAPSCVNPYKYRDSKSNLPLCSLKCYKATR